MSADEKANEEARRTSSGFQMRRTDEGATSCSQTIADDGASTSLIKLLGMKCFNRNCSDIDSWKKSTILISGGSLMLDCY